MILETSDVLPVFDSSGFPTVQADYNTEQTPLDITSSVLLEYTGYGDIYIRLLKDKKYEFNGLEVANTIEVVSTGNSQIGVPNTDTIGSGDIYYGEGEEFGGTIYATEECVVRFHADTTSEPYDAPIDNGSIGIKVSTLSYSELLPHGVANLSTVPNIPTAIATPTEETVFGSQTGDFNIIHRSVPTGELPDRDITVDTQHMTILINSTSDLSIAIDLDGDEYTKTSKINANVVVGETKVIVINRSHVTLSISPDSISDITITAFGITEEEYTSATAIFPTIGKHPIKFFVSENEVVPKNITPLLGSNDIAIAFDTATGKILMVSKTKSSEFLGGVDIQEIINNQSFISKVEELTNISFTMNISDNNGNTVADAVVTQVDATTFDVTVPQELVGTSYKIVLNRS